MALRDGLRALMARDRAVESWLHNQAGPAYDALKADPSRAVTAGEVRARLAAEHATSARPWRTCLRNAIQLHRFQMRVANGLPRQPVAGS